MSENTQFENSGGRNLVGVMMGGMFDEKLKGGGLELTENLPLHSHSDRLEKFLGKKLPL